MWKLPSEHPPLGARIIALYDDGSGSVGLYVTGTNEFMDDEGEQYEMDLSDNYSYWALAPEGYTFFFERDDEPAETVDA